MLKLRFFVLFFFDIFENSDEANVTESLMRDVRKRKKRSKSARRKRTESTTFARSFMSANNATSRHIAKGNAMRRKRQEHLDIQKRVAQARWVSIQSDAVSKCSCNYR